MQSGGALTPTPAAVSGSTARARLEQELAKVRAEGVAVDNEENARGIICVGGPIFASDGKPIAALSISGPSIRMSQNLPAIKTAVREAVQKMSLLLGHEVLPSPSPELGGSEAMTTAPAKTGPDLA